MNIRTKLISIMIPLGVLGAVAGGIAGNSGVKALEQSSQNALSAVRTTQKRNIEQYFKTINGQIRTLANDRMMIDAMVEFKGAFNSYRDERVAAGHNPNSSSVKNSLRQYYVGEFARRYGEVNPSDSPNMDSYYNGLDADSVALQHAYISGNSNPLGAKDELQQASDGTNYSRLHAKYHPHVRDYLKTFGYYDIFLVDPDTGDIIYSVYKELDYTTSLINGPYADTGIGHAFKEARELEAGEVAVTDFARYLPSYDAYAGFFATPIYHGDEKLGVLIFQAPIDRLNDIMTFGHNWESTGLGLSGETYIVAADKTLRNDSRFLIDDPVGYFDALRVSNDPALAEIESRSTSVGLQRADTPGVQAALRGETGFDIFADYRNVSVLSAYAPLEIPGLDWVLMSEIDESEAYAAVKTTQLTLIAGSTIIAVIILLGSIFLIRAIVKPLRHLQNMVAKLAAGDDSVRANLKSGDELEELANAFDNLLDERFSKMVQAGNENDLLNNSVVSLLDGVSSLSERDLTVRLPVAEDVTGPVADAVNMMATEMADVLHAIRDVAGDVEKAAQSVQVQGASVSEMATNEREIVNTTMTKLEDASKNMSRIAALAQKCNSIAANASRTTQDALTSVTNTADGMGEIRETISETEKRIKRLGERSQEISGIVEIINNIAERTHVLALNASMQAAAAGEAGRGFSVVADEVQRLAESSRQSTSEIESLVSNIQSETAETMATMNKTISQVVSGAELAKKSGEEMRTTQATTLELAQAVEQIAKQSLVQAQSSKSLREHAGQLVASTDETKLALDAQSKVTSNLAIYSKRLLDSVNVFKLVA